MLIYDNDKKGMMVGLVELDLYNRSPFDCPLYVLDRELGYMDRVFHTELDIRNGRIPDVNRGIAQLFQVNICRVPCKIVAYPLHENNNLARCQLIQKNNESPVRGIPCVNIFCSDTFTTITKVKGVR